MGEEVDCGVFVVLQIEFRIVRFKGSSVGKVRLFRVLTNNNSDVILVFLLFKAFQGSQRIIVEANGSRGLSGFIREWDRLFNFLFLFFFRAFVFAIRH